MPAPALKHFHCPVCGRLTSKPWDAAWCAHHDSNAQPSAPHWLDPEDDNPPVRMHVVTSVTSQPAGPDEWVVVEYQNSIGWQSRSDPALPGDPDVCGTDWTRRVAAGPMSQADAYADAQARPRRDGWPSHMHGWEAMPADLAAHLPRIGS